MYRIQYQNNPNRFGERNCETAGEVLAAVAGLRAAYTRIAVYRETEPGQYHCELMVENGEVSWGEYSLQKAMEIRLYELDRYGELAEHTTLEQVEEYYADNREEILDSLWPELPEWQEVVDILVRENHPGIFPAHHSSVRWEDGFVTAAIPEELAPARPACAVVDANLSVFEMTLQAARLLPPEEAAAMKARVAQAVEYEEAIGILEEYVDLRFESPEQEQGMVMGY